MEQRIKRKRIEREMARNIVYLESSEGNYREAKLKLEELPLNF